MNLTKDIARNSVFILIPAAIVAAFLPWKKLPFSILIGGLLGILNMKALAWSVKGVLGTSHASAKMLFFAQFRFVMLVVIVTALAYLKLVTIPGLLAGFSVVFLQVLITGLRHARRPGS
ncbi:MAG: hypothetical protein FIA94_11835 [Nitrospirae bacterium]|nr:hypothetical protein [Nitrospirota bacterium]